MDFTNMTFAQVLMLVNERRPELVKEINDLSQKLSEARKAHEKAEDAFYGTKPRDPTRQKAFNDAVDNYCKLDNKLFKLHQENDQLRDFARNLNNLSDCKDLRGVADLFMGN